MTSSYILLQKTKKKIKAKNFINGVRQTCHKIDLMVSLISSASSSTNSISSLRSGKEKGQLY